MVLAPTFSSRQGRWGESKPRRRWQGLQRAPVTHSTLHWLVACFSTVPTKAHLPPQLPPQHSAGHKTAEHQRQLEAVASGSPQ